jgi:Mn-containing catalase
MLLEGVTGELKDAIHKTSLAKVMSGASGRDSLVHEALTDPMFFVHSGGGPRLTDANGVPWTGNFVNANGDLTVDLRSNIAAESRAKIVYEYLLQFTEDPYVQESLNFLMTREIAHFKMFNAALETIEPNFPPGVLQGDPRYTHTYFNMSNGKDVRGPWNQGQGTPLNMGEEWTYYSDPIQHVRETTGLQNEPVPGGDKRMNESKKLDKQMSELRSSEIKSATPTGKNQWSEYELTRK